MKSYELKCAVHTMVGKKRLVRNILNVIATVKVPRKRITERRKTSATAWVMLESLQASPVKLQPRSKQSSSVTHSRLTSTRSLPARQLLSNWLSQSTTLYSVNVKCHFITTPHIIHPFPKLSTAILGSKICYDSN